MNKISLSHLETSLFEPFDIEFSHTQISLYDSTFKEASLLLEKAENLRSSFTIPIKTLLNTCDCEILVDGIQAWIYSISANCQGRILESGLKFETQNPYIKLGLDLSRSDCGIFFENLKQFFRVAFEARANLFEINQNLQVLGHRAENFFNTIKTETQKLELNSISASIIRRNITQNIQKIAASFQKIKGLDAMFKTLEHDKTHFFQICNNFIMNSDEIGLRGWYENRLIPRQFKDILCVSPLIVNKHNEGDFETTVSEKLEKEKPNSEFTTECKNEETKISESNNQVEVFNFNIQVDFEESDYNNNNNNKYANSDKIKENNEVGGLFPMMIPFNCLKISNEIIGASVRGKILEAYFMNKRCSMKNVKMEEFQILSLLTEINNMSLFKGHNFVTYLGFSLIKEPLSLYLIYEAFPYDLHDLLFKKKKDFRFNEKIEICLEILKALDLLNKMEMCHGHLTTRNILIDSNFKPFVADYGLGKFNKKNYYNKYDSLEFLKDGKYRKEQDVYSFGVIFYEIMNEKKAWNGLKEEDILMEKKKLNFFNRNNKNAKEIDEIVEKCVNFEEEERPKPSDLLFMLNKLKK